MFDSRGVVNPPSGPAPAAPCDGLRWAALGVLAASVVACGSEVSLGSAAPVFDLSHCQGADCSVVAARAELAAYPPPTTCDAGPSKTVDAAFEIFLQPLSPVCDPESPEFDEFVCELGSPRAQSLPTVCPILGSCMLNLATLAGAPDGSVFALVIGTGWEDDHTLQNRSALWLRHYAEDGTLLRETLLVADLLPPDEVINYTPDLSVDARGHAFVVLSSARRPVRPSVATTELPSDPASLFEFDARGRPVGAPIAFAPRDRSNGGQVLVSARAGDGIVLAEQAFGGGALAFFEPLRRALRWVHDRRGRLAISGVAADSEGEVTLSTRFPTGMFSGRLEHYTADGTLSWERGLVQQPEDPFGNDPLFAVTRDRGVVMAQPGLLAPSNEGQADGSIVMGSVTSLSAIGAGGDPLFQINVSAPVVIDAEGNTAGWSYGGSSARPVTTNGGSIVFPAAEYRVADRPTVTVIGVVSGDGRRCARYDWPHYGIQGGGAFVAAGDNIYVMAYPGFARLQLPEELLP